MAFDQSASFVTVPVSADLSTRQFQFVSINGSGQLAVTADAAAADGVLLDNHADTQGKPGNIASFPGSICRVLAGGTIAAGANCEVASGKAVTIASGKIVGKAMVAAVANDVFTMLLVLQK